MILWMWKNSFSERSWLVGDGCSNVLQQRLWEGVQHQAKLWGLLQVERTTKIGQLIILNNIFSKLNSQCRYHPGDPYFHDAYKGWSCCQVLDIMQMWPYWLHLFFLRTNQQTSPLSWTHLVVLWASTAMWSRSTPRRSRATWTRSQNLWWSRPDLLFSLKVKSGSAI